MSRMERVFFGLILAIVTLSSGEAGNLRLESTDLSPRLSIRHVYDGYGCGGENLSPELSWSGEPKGTKSFAVTMYDPDAPREKGWWHWILFDIPKGVHRLPRGAGNPEKGLLPPGAKEGKNDFGTLGYGGACPPRGHGPHRYIFTLYALKKEHLPLKPEMSPAEAAAVIEKYAMEKASIVSRYGR
ncbi:YbhB/YbcL family Raf kinase inhibitor-like protein [Hydrogenimonas sp.]